MSAAIKTIGIVTKHRVPEAQKLGREAAAYLVRKGRKVLLDEDNEKDELIRRCDLIVVFGGDGTFLSVARRMEKRSIPILGINMGQLGFLTEVKKSEYQAALDAALKGKLRVSERTLLECTHSRRGKALSRTVVVNDVVVSKGAIARIFDMQVSVDAQLVSNIKADGLIVSTPTGSTAYCLAAGGPIVVPEMAAMILAPICPHSLTLRPLVVPDSSAITIVPQYKSGTVILTLDGQASVELRTGDVIRITKFTKHPIRILNAPERDYYSLLREKLKYGYRD